jgi:hypothetical protein
MDPAEPSIPAKGAKVAKVEAMKLPVEPAVLGQTQEAPLDALGAVLPQDAATARSMREKSAMTATTLLVTAAARIAYRMKPVATTSSIPEKSVTTATTLLVTVVA